MLNFERIKWGGVRHLYPIYAAFDLEQFQRLDPVIPEPIHVELLKEILRSIEGTDSTTTAAQLQEHLKMLKSNKAERDVLIGILGICGILETNDHPGFLASFISESERVFPDRRFVDMTYPACWWTRTSGLNWKAVDFWFGHLLNAQQDGNYEITTFP